MSDEQENIEPSKSAANGKDPKTGRFAPGNKMGKGNPLARERAQKDRLWHEVVSHHEATAFIRKIYEDAMSGDRAAREMFCERFFGKTPTNIEASLDATSLLKTYLGVDLDAV